MARRRSPHFKKLAMAAGLIHNYDTFYLRCQLSEVQTQMAALWNLKKVAEKIARIKADVEKIPSEIEGLKGTLKGSMSSFDSEKQKIAALEKTIRDAEAEAKLESERIAKAEAKVSSATNPTELAAATKEQAEHQKEKAKHEAVAAKATSDLEAKKAGLATFQSGIEASQGKTQEQCDELETTLGKLRDELTQLEAKQAEGLKLLSNNISAIYGRIARVKGNPIAEVSGGFCGSCHVRVRPQLYNELLGFKQLHQCSNCGKLLVVPLPQAEAGDKVHDLTA